MSEHAPNGFARMNAEATATILENHEAAARLQTEQNIKQGIENRAVSSEVAGLKRRAHLEIYGNGDYTVVDPRTGAVLDDSRNPQPGVIEQIRKDRSYGTTEEARDTAADKYARDVDQLTSLSPSRKSRVDATRGKLKQSLREDVKDKPADEREQIVDDFEAAMDRVDKREARAVSKQYESGFELCQAKLILDLRAKDKVTRANLTAKYIASGMSAKEADKKANELYAKEDLKRRQLIKDKGVFTLEDYQRALRGERLYDDEGNYIPLTPPVTEQTPSVPTEANPDQELDHLRGAIRYGQDEAIEEAYAIKDFAERSAIRGTTAAFRGAKNGRGHRRLHQVGDRERISSEALEASRNRLEEIRRQNHDQLRTRLAGEGFDNDTINRVLMMQDGTFAMAINSETIQAKLQLAGLRADGSDIRTRFYSWWARQGGGGDGYFSRNRLTGTLKKAAVIGVIGVPAGVLGAIIAPAIGGAIGAVGAAFAARTAFGLARGMTSSRIERNADATVAQHQGAIRTNDTLQGIGNYYQSLDPGAVNGPELITDTFKEGIQSDVRRNRIRTGAILGSAALGAGAAAGLSMLGEHIANGGSQVAHHLSGGAKVPQAGGSVRPLPHGHFNHHTDQVVHHVEHSINTPKAVDIHQYTWSVAHKLAPHHEVEAMRTALSKFNLENKTAYQLVPYNNTTEIGQIVNGQFRAIDPATMYKLNAVLEQAYTNK